MKKVKMWNIKGLLDILKQQVKGIYIYLKTYFWMWKY